MLEGTMIRSATYNEAIDRSETNLLLSIPMFIIDFYAVYEWNWDKEN